MAQTRPSKADASAFLFTLINPDGIVPTMLAISAACYHCAVYNRSNYSATFGGGSDLHLCANSNTEAGSNSHLGVSYTDTTGKGHRLFTGAQQLGTMAEILAFSV